MLAIRFHQPNQYIPIPIPIPTIKPNNKPPKTQTGSTSNILNMALLNKVKCLHVEYKRQLILKKKNDNLTKLTERFQLNAVSMVS